MVHLKLHYLINKTFFFSNKSPDFYWHGIKYQRRSEHFVYYGGTFSNYVTSFNFCSLKNIAKRVMQYIIVILNMELKN